MTRILLIRHGNTDGNRTGVFQGTMDTPLNEMGCQQAEFLAGRLQDFDLDAVYSSPLRRALETADHICERRGFAPIIVQELHELFGGDLQGNDTATNIRKYPGAMATMRDRPDLFYAPRGESTVEVYARTVSTMKEIAQRHLDQFVAVVTHGHFIEAYLSYVQSGTLSHMKRCIVNNASITELHFLDVPRPILAQFNDDSHIPQAQRFGVRNQSLNL